MVLGDAEHLLLDGFDLLFRLLFVILLVLLLLTPVLRGKVCVQPFWVLLVLTFDFL